MKVAQGVLKTNNCVMILQTLYIEYYVLETVKLLSPGQVHNGQLSKTSHSFKIKYNYDGL